MTLEEIIFTELHYINDVLEARRITGDGKTVLSEADERTIRLALVQAYMAGEKAARREMEHRSVLC